MSPKQVKVLILTILAVFSMVSAAVAAGSGAFRLELPGAEALGKGSAFVGQADDPTAIYYNPAGLTQVEGTQATMGISFLQPNTWTNYYHGNKFYICWWISSFRCYFAVKNLI